MSARFSVEYEFSDTLAGRAANSFIHLMQKDLAVKFWTALPVLFVYTCLSGLLLLLVYVLETPDWLLLIPAGLAGLFGGMLALLLLLHSTALFFEAVARWRIRRQLVAAFPAMGDRTVRWTFADDKFEVHSAISDRQVPWSAVRLFRPDPEFWVIGIMDGPELLLPVEFLSAEVQELIRDKAGALAADHTSLRERQQCLDESV